MKKHASTVLLALVFLTGLSVLLYPAISGLVSSRSQSRAVARFYEDLAATDGNAYEALLEAGREYNRALALNPNRYQMTGPEVLEYRETLNFSGSGILGALEIPVINVRLPIYHGTNETVLQAGLGHLEGSSLPIGGPGTHAAITGHRGLPSSTLLANLDQVSVGDTFTLSTLAGTLLYEVDRILVVEPEDLSALAIAEGMDYCTIVTCTPYGINTHRLLARGRRVESVESVSVVTADARPVGELLVMSIVAAPMLLCLLAYLLVKARRTGFLTQSAVRCVH